MNKIHQRFKYKNACLKRHKKSHSWIVFDSGKFEIKVNQVKPRVEVKPTYFGIVKLKKYISGQPAIRNLMTTFSNQSCRV